MNRTNTLIGCALVVLALFALVWLIPHYTSPPSSRYDVAPAFMPSIAAYAILFLGAALAIRSGIAWRRDVLGDESDHDEFQGEVTGLDKVVLTNLAVWIAVAIGTILGLRYVGFHITATLLLAGTMLYVGYRRPWIIAGIALILPPVVSQIVWHSFTVALP